MERPKVLVIDDEAGPRESLRMILKDNCEVMLAAGPIEGLKLAEQHRPDMVFLDIKMPEMEGTEVLRRIKEIDPDIEVSLFTAFAAVDTAQQALRYGAIDYLTKPFSVEEVTEVLTRALQRRRERQKERALLQQLQPAAQAISGHLQALDDRASAEDERQILQNLTEAHSSIETQLSKVARLNAIGEIAAEVAHDVSNFLTAILLRIEMLLMNLKQSQRVDADTVKDALQDIVQAARNGVQAVQRISGISKSDPYEPSQAVNVNDVISDVVNLSIGQFNNGQGSKIGVQTGQVPPVFGSPTALRTAVMNIVINARQALTNGGQVWVATFAEDDQVIIQVRDTGVGIPPEVMARITEPFFTTKGEQGSGLGLSVARKVIARHEGTLSFDSQAGKGTTVTIRLPVAKDYAPSDKPARREAARAAEDVPDVLVVDDDNRMLNTLRASLVATGMVAEGAKDAETGLRKFEDYLRDAQRAPGVVVADLRMPGLLGTDMAKRIKQLAPNTRFILISAYVNDEPALVSCPYLDAVIKKPFKISDLLEHMQFVS